MAGAGAFVTVEALDESTVVGTDTPLLWPYINSPADITLGGREIGMSECRGRFTTGLSVDGDEDAGTVATASGSESLGATVTSGETSFGSSSVDGGGTEEDLDFDFLVFITGDPTI